MDRLLKSQRPPAGMQKDAFEVRFLDVGDKVIVTTYNHSTYYFIVQSIDDQGRPFLVTEHASVGAPSLSGFLKEVEIQKDKFLILEKANGLQDQTSAIKFLQISYAPERVEAPGFQEASAIAQRTSQLLGVVVQDFIAEDPEEVEAQKTLTEIGKVLSAIFPGSSVMNYKGRESRVEIITPQGGVIKVVATGGTLEIGLRTTSPTPKEQVFAAQIADLLRESGKFALGKYKYTGNLGEHYVLAKV